MHHRLAWLWCAGCVLLVGVAASGQDGASTSVMQDNVVVLVAASGSMNEPMRGTNQTKMALAKEALTNVIAEVPDSTNVGILVFSGRNVPNEWIYPLGPIDRDRVLEAIRRPTASGGTPLGRYMKKASDRLLEQRAAQYGYGSYRLLIVTDGEARDRKLVDRYLPDIVSRGIVVDVIGVDMKASHTLATRVHSYRRADDPEALVRAVAEVFAEVGQSTDDATGEDQFELIQAIPEEMAGAVLVALARSGNEPIGDSEPRRARSPRTSDRSNLPPDAGNPSNAPPSGGSGSRGIPSGWIGAIILSIFILTAIVRRIARHGGGH